ncbi:MAG: hypothetical protein P1P88_12940 [Bacteroidales bacterium]|nr:hypothetical protein [Bacteroidales bacterium]
MKIKILVLGLLVFLLSGVHSYSQVALAVSKNENGSSVKYSLKTGATLEEAYTKVQKDLEEQDMKNIFVLKSTENTGHELKSGHYVMIISSRKNGGRFFVSYGLGVSPNSREEAEQRALVHLMEHDWGYDKNMGHAIEKEGMLEDLTPSEEEK